MRAIVANRPDIQLTVIGSGEHGEERQLQELAIAAGIFQHIDIRGWMQPRDIPAVLAQAGVALVPVDDTLINRARCSGETARITRGRLTRGRQRRRRNADVCAERIQRHPHSPTPAASPSRRGAHAPEPTSPTG
jgi:hypothetical protein